MDFALPLENKKISDSSLETKIREILNENERELFRIVTRSEEHTSELQSPS